MTETTKPTDDQRRRADRMAGLGVDPERVARLEADKAELKQLRAAYSKRGRIATTEDLDDQLEAENDELKRDCCDAPVSMEIAAECDEFKCVPVSITFGGVKYVPEDQGGTYLDTLTPEILEAADRVTGRMNGNLRSDIWSNKETEKRDYAALAAQWRWLHPASKLSDWEAAEAWVRAFRSDIYGD